MLMKLFTPQKLPLFEVGVYLKVVVARNCFEIVFFITFNLFGTSYNMRGSSALKVNIFRLQVYERVGVSLIEVNEKVKRLKGGNMHFMAVKKSRKRSCFEIYSYLKDSALIAVKRNAKF